MKQIVVQKYGGSSVADVDKIRGVAERIINTRKAGYDVVAVVSAMGSSTDNLIKQARQVSTSPKKRELDMLLSVGERITMSLLSMAIEDMGFEALSFTGSQCGIITSDSHSNARIIDVRPIRIEDELERGKIVIVAGFQGMSYKREVTTLGRGGSDTTAIAIASALNAKYCEICSDVDGVYTSDPRRVDTAQKINQLNYDEMEALGEAGSEVLNPDAIEFARRRGLTVKLSSTFKDGNGTLLLEQSTVSEDPKVKAVACREQIYYLHSSKSDNGTLDKILDILDQQRIPTDTLSMNSAGIGIATNPDKVPNWEKLKSSLKDIFKDSIITRDDLGTVSLVGNALSSSPKSLKTALTALNKAEIDYHDVSMSRSCITFILSATDVLQASKTLHDTFFPIRSI